MATKGMKQPYWIAADFKTVMTKAEGERAVYAVCENYDEAIDVCDRAIAAFQIKKYGFVDPSREVRKFET